jgi:hypothetical protein
MAKLTWKKAVIIALVAYAAICVFAVVASGWNNHGTNGPVITGPSN